MHASAAQHVQSGIKGPGRVESSHCYRLAERQKKHPISDASPLQVQRFGRYENSTKTPFLVAAGNIVALEAKAILNMLASDNAVDGRCKVNKELNIDYNKCRGW